MCYEVESRRSWVPYALVAAALGGILAISGCAQVQQAAAKIDPALQTACNDAMLVAPLVPAIGVYVTAGCTTAEGLTKLAADPTSAEWLGTLVGQIKALSGPVALK